MEKAIEQFGAAKDWFTSLLDKPLGQFTLLDIGGIGLIVLAILILALALDY